MPVWEVLDEIAWLTAPAILAVVAAGVLHVRVERFADEVGATRIAALSALAECPSWPDVEAATEAVEACSRSTSERDQASACVATMCSVAFDVGPASERPGEARAALAEWVPASARAASRDPDDVSVVRWALTRLAGHVGDRGSFHGAVGGSVGAGWMLFSAAFLVSRTIRTVTSWRVGLRASVSMGLGVGACAVWLGLGALTRGELLGFSADSAWVGAAGVLAGGVLPACLVTMALAIGRGRAGWTAAVAAGASFPALAAAQLVLLAQLTPRESDVGVVTVGAQVVFLLVAAQATHLVQRRLLRVPTVR
jgi:hypothetical protein